MKLITKAAIAVVVLACFVGGGSVSTGPEEPCDSQQSNFEMRQCYTKAQGRVNHEADWLVTKIAASLREDMKGPLNSGVVNEELGKAAVGILRSQKSWRAYRDVYCEAVADSWTTGSGAGTAFEACMFNLGQQRVRELRSDFNEPGDTK